MRIAVCDDCHEITGTIAGLIGSDHIVTVFHTGKDLIKANSLHIFDLVFLDVELPDMTGLEVAQALRSVSKQQLLIFVSNYEEVVYASIKLEPFRFIRKRLLQEELRESLAAAEERYVSLRREYVISTKGRDWKFKIDEIQYIEEQGHYANFHTTAGMVELRLPMKQLANDLETAGFVRSHISFLINMAHIRELKGNLFIMENGDEIPISKNYQKNAKDTYILYLRRL